MFKRFFVPFVIAGWMLTSAAHAAPAPQPEYYDIAPQDLSPQDSTAINSFIIYTNELWTDSPNNMCFVTGVHLPQGATIKRLYVYLSSDDGTDLFVNLKRHDMTNDFVASLFENYISENQSKYAYAILPISKYNTVNNARFIYSFKVCVIKGTAFHGAIITYIPKT